MSFPNKTTLRKTALEKRLALDVLTYHAFSQALCERLLTVIEALTGTPKTIAGYVPARNEVDIMPVLAALATHHTIALPLVSQGSKVLSFKAYTPGEALAPGAYGIPMPAANAPEVTPDIALVPMLAFDRAGHRLGYGGGYYDATLSSFGHHPVAALGIAFGLQEVDIIPAEPFDVRMHAIITEKEIIKPV